MNHHEAVKMISGLGLGGQTALTVQPRSEEFIKVCVVTRDEITIVFHTRFGNEQKGHIRTVALENHAGRWVLADNTMIPMKSKLTSRTGSLMTGLPGLAANSPKIQPDFGDLTVGAASVIPGLVNPDAEVERAAVRAAAADRAAKRAAAERRARLELAARRRRARLARTPGGRHVIRQEAKKAKK